MMLHKSEKSFFLGQFSALYNLDASENYSEEKKIFIIENRFSKNRVSRRLWADMTLIFGFSMVDYIWPTRFQLERDLSVGGPPSSV